MIAKNKRTVSFQAPSTEVANWNSEAEMLSISFSEFVRRRLNGKRLPSVMPSYSTEIATGLADFSNHLNELADLKLKLNGDPVTQRDIDDCLTKMAEILVKLRGCM